MPPRTRRPRGAIREPHRLFGDDTASFLSDAARTPGGFSPSIAFPKTEGEVAWLFAEAAPVLPVGAQSSLTGGATPFGETLLATRDFARLDFLDGARARVGAGLALSQIEAEAAPRELFFPPAPTFDGAFIGGAAATNAAGARTFKYGVTRDWIEALTVVLASGEVLDIERGRHFAEDGRLAIEDLGGAVTRIPVPAYAMPEVAKCSAGYFAAPGMDLIDLFIGAEGSLGVVTELTIRLARKDFSRLYGFVTVKDAGAGIALSGALREATELGVASIECLDGPSLGLLRREGQDAAAGVELPEDRRFALLFELELPRSYDEDAATDELAAAFEGSEDGRLGALCALLRRHDALDHFDCALPGDDRRMEQLASLRDQVPVIVNHGVADARREVDDRIKKTAADMCVPWERFEEMWAAYEEVFERRGLRYAIWGHISDGNVHPNVLPRRYEDVAAAEEACLELGRKVTALGGSPLAEHGVGRNPMKQALLRQLYGEEGIAAMRAVKAALDPQGRLAPGVLFPAGG